MKDSILISIFFGLFTYLLFDISQNKKQPKEQKYQKEIFSKEFSGHPYVTDGDTLKFGKKRVRLLFIDAPETKQTCFDKNKEEYFCGKMSTKFLINFIDKRKVTCRYEKLDIYKRYLGECFVGKISLNKAMIKNGMAIIYSFKATDPELKKLQQKARENKLGVWQGAFENPKNYRKRIRRNNG